MERFQKININDPIWVKLDDEGFRILCRLHNNLAEIDKDVKRLTVQDLKEDVDEEGYTRFQIWDFMHCFGHHMIFGHRPPFHLDVKLKREESTAEKIIGARYHLWIAYLIFSLGVSLFLFLIIKFLA